MPDDPQRWSSLIDEAVLSFLAGHGHADLDGLLHVLQRNRLAIELEDLKGSVARLVDQGKVKVALEGEARSPVVRLVKEPFFGFT